ncbi:MAG: tetratricopeptide repeat protein [Planctomycetes bacterium]|nr:tetratricopeptide repeat protein [Planctomycetota bacterium]
MRQCDNPSASSLLGPLAVPRLWRGLVLWLLLLLVLLPAASQSQSPPAPPRPKRSTPAWLALYKGEYKRAGELLAQAAAAEPANPEPRLGLARHREETGDYDGAEAALREALALAPAHREARARLAELLLYRGRAADALALAESFLKESAADPIGTALKGLVQIDRGEFAEAEKTLNAALDANYSGEVEDPDDLYFVALAAREYGNRTGDSGTLKLVAHELVPKIVEADKFYHRARVLEAGLYMEKDNAPAGAKTYNESLDLNPYHPLAHVGRAFVAIHDGKLDEAEREIARALQINPALP